MEVITFIIILVTALIFLLVGYYIGKKLTDRDWIINKIQAIRDEAVKKSREVIGGQFSEQLAPYLPDFPYKPTEARFVGKPIDLIIFRGMDEKDIQEVIFVEIKSGKSGLTSHERKLRDTIKNKKVSWVEYKIPEELTKKEQ